MDDCEIILVHKRHPPDRRLLLIVMGVVAVLSVAGGMEAAGSLIAASGIGVAVFVLGWLAFPWVFYLKTNQLGVPAELLANTTYVRGYMQWPPLWPYSFLESPIRFAWAAVRQAQIRPVPWVYALANIQLELTLRDGKTRILRLPRLSDEEQGQLCAALAAIATRRGFDFSIAPQIGPVKHDLG